MAWSALVAVAATGVVMLSSWRCCSSLLSLSSWMLDCERVDVSVQAVTFSAEEVELPPVAPTDVIELNAGFGKSHSVIVQSCIFSISFHCELSRRFQTNRSHWQSVDLLCLRRLGAHAVIVIGTQQSTRCKLQCALCVCVCVFLTIITHARTDAR